MRTADSHARRTKFAGIVAVVENVYCILMLGVAGERAAAGLPPFTSAARAQGNQRARRLADPSRFETSRPVRILASRKFGVTTVANGSITSRIIVIASGSSRTSPLAATITESTTIFGILRMRIRSATASIISARESIPIFAAAIVKSSATASICAATKAGSRLAIALTPSVFCAVIAVIALVPKTANAAKL
jgi:hypothetical protein